MANLTKAQIDELKEKGFITQVVPSADLANNTVDELKIDKLVTITDPSADIEAAVTHDIPVEGISIPETLALELGGDGTFTVIFTPKNATNKNVTVVTSDPDIVTVGYYSPSYQEVFLMAGGIGNATITVTTEDGGFTAECQVTVEDPFIPVEGVEITNEETSVDVGSTLSIDYSITPDDATNQNVTMESSDESVFTVHFNKHDGWYITGVGADVATLTVTTEDGGYTDTVEITAIDV